MSARDQAIIDGVNALLDAERLLAETSDHRFICQIIDDASGEVVLQDWTHLIGNRAAIHRYVDLLLDGFDNISKPRS